LNAQGNNQKTAFLLEEIMNMKNPSDTGKKSGKSGINCFSCGHFYITYEQSFPYGCKAMGFKSRLIPSREVYLSSGIECQHFLKKQPP